MSKQDKISALKIRVLSANYAQTRQASTTNANNKRNKK